MTPQEFDAAHLWHPYTNVIKPGPTHVVAGAEGVWLTLEDGTAHPGIQVCILSKRVLDLVWRNREEVPHPGDTFIVDMDLSEENLPAGQLLQVGSAALRVSDVFNDGCVKWKARYGTAAKDWVNLPENRALRRRGILCSVERAGSFSNGDFMIKK